MRPSFRNITSAFSIPQRVRTFSHAHLPTRGVAALSEHYQIQARILDHLDHLDHVPIGVTCEQFLSDIRHFLDHLPGHLDHFVSKHVDAHFIRQSCTTGSHGTFYRTTGPLATNRTRVWRRVGKVEKWQERPHAPQLPYRPGAPGRESAAPDRRPGHGEASRREDTVACLGSPLFRRYRHGRPAFRTPIARQPVQHIPAFRAALFLNLDIQPQPARPAA
jgi:hypothetical protein